MRLDQFHYELPEALIANQPTIRRTDSRLLVLDGATGAVAHKRFTGILSLIEPGDLLVMNDTRVIPARLHGAKATGGRVEILVERLLGERRMLAHVRASKSPGPGTRLNIEGGYQAMVIARDADLYVLEAVGNNTAMDIVNTVGHMPLPPYIDRADTAHDRERYQTVYARVPGAIAAPTAGLHFDDNLLGRLRAKGVNIAFVTLHVGAGTFQPVRVENIEQHHMHSEFVDVNQVVCEQVEATRAAGKRIIAVGTTSVRCLETAGRDGIMRPVQGETDIFIYPGYKFRTVDALITNFHLSESTLLMLVCAFAGYQRVLESYRQAIAQRYRFFSYGDAMLVTRNPYAVEDMPQ